MSDKKASSAGEANQYKSPPGPPPYAAKDEQYPPPPGPPPSQLTSYTAPPGLPPSHSQKGAFAPPLGPPPSHTVQGKGKGSADEPPSYDDLDDNSSLPPPPSLFKFDERSPGANASADSAERAQAWCRNNRLYGHRPLSPKELQDVRTGNVTLLGPPGHVGSFACGVSLFKRQRGQTEDTVNLTNLPIFAAVHDNPARTGYSKVIYFEISIHSIGSVSPPFVESGLAIGFVAPPYPAWRLPGWQRGSLAVMSDDGRRYIDDDGGGQDFTRPFESGETLGLGMRFDPGPRHNKVSVFFTRNGQETGGWDLYETRDADDQGSVEGLEGFHDLFGAVGCFGHVEYEARFRPAQWLYQPSSLLT